MLRALGKVGRILLQTWPALLAWFLAGTLVREAVIAFAAPIGPESPLAALLLVPVVVLARLVSYIGMFLVLRRALPGYRLLSGGDVTFTSFRDMVSEFVRVLLVSIGPFFILYAAIGLLNEDLSAYARAAFRYAFLSENPRVLDVGDGPLALTVVIVAFVGRWLLTIFGPKLPGWVAIPQVYLEATWVFVALTALGNFFGVIQEWISGRQVVQWWEGLRGFFSGLWDPIRIAIDNLDWITPVALQLVLLPIAWLVVASIIYLRSLGNVVEDAPPIPSSVGRAVTKRVSRVPKVLQRYRHLVTGIWDDVGRPVIVASRIVAKAGFTRIVLFLAAYGFLFAFNRWATRWLYEAVGPHEPAFWWIADAGLSIVMSAVLEPLRIVLLAFIFDLGLRRWAAARASTPPAVAATEPVRT